MCFMPVLALLSSATSLAAFESVRENVNNVHQLLIDDHFAQFGVNVLQYAACILHVAYLDSKADNFQVYHVMRSTYHVQITSIVDGCKL